MYTVNFFVSFNRNDVVSYLRIEKGSFFKAHKDTPHGKNMFGSLVVAFPTAHEGGTLVLRHKGEQWTWDSGKILAQQTNPLSVAYIAFYSNVEHEIAEVTSGNRVTLTYNLYFKFAQGQEQAEDSEVQPSNIDARINVNPTPPSNKAEFKSTLSRLLLDPEFLPHGGRLGFGLQHQYPVDSETGSVDGLLNCLKGSDAVIRRVCQELSLEASLQVMYADDDDYDEKDDRLVMVPEVPDMEGFPSSEQRISYNLRDYFDGRFVKSRGLMERGAEGTEEIWWVTPMTALTRATTPFVIYGNEAQLAYMYGDICLIVDVGKAGNRETEHKTKGDVTKAETR
jgi:hypothetical protein